VQRSKGEGTRIVAAVHVTSDCSVAPDRGPRAAFNAGACVWQLREAASWRAAATRLQRPDRWALAKGAVSKKWARSYLIST
jgi:hypothetical protein